MYSIHEIKLKASNHWHGNLNTGTYISQPSAHSSK